MLRLSSASIAWICSTLLSFSLLACESARHIDDGPNNSEDAGPRADAGNSGRDAADGPCADRPGKLRGKSNQSVMVGAVGRTFVYYAPEGLDPSEPAPLVIAPHGFAMSGEIMSTITGFMELADSEGFVAVFPDGANLVTPWNVGAGVSGAGAILNGTADDQGFIDQIVAFVDADQCLDRDHLFVSGFSMGGYLANETGCLRSDLAAVGPHSGGSHDLASCPGSIKPVILFHGDADSVIAYAENGLLARDRWLARNGCSANFDATPVQGGTCEYYKDCPDSAQVALCHFDGMGHTWAGGPAGPYGNPDYESAAQLAWGFWKKYAW